MKTIITFIVAALLVSIGYSQQSNQKIEMVIDAIGNAKINISMTMNAAQWQQWNGTYGANPSALKRDMERSMPAYIVDDFKLDKDDMNRSFNLSLNAYGVCKIDKRGRWIMDTDQKDAQLTELTEHKYMLVSSPPEFGGTVQQTFIIEFPEAAEDIKIDKDSFGKSIFEFEMENPSTSFSLLRWSGLILLLLGGGWLGKSTLSKN
ncbi:hypothetical protein [Psychroserpens sp. SPM9]|uniref:hypothetical protein n=1 Tax=Psychroserpens sp. SPM9 TaxID=2975598 RepID=UPI0021A3547A|nr:hypothetical protein [Psychroserpens sp. SPM9]MDG5490551.1 hypothetical protein [Psychroserpens sp. SPM9]